MEITLWLFPPYNIFYNAEAMLGKINVEDNLVINFVVDVYTRS